MKRDMKYEVLRRRKKWHLVLDEEGNEREVPSNYVESKKRCILFVRIKDVRNIDLLKGSFEIRWRLWVYFRDEKFTNAMRRHVTRWAETKSSEFREYTDKLKELDEEWKVDVDEYVPKPSLSNRIEIETTGDPEIIHKKSLGLGETAWCYTEQFSATVDHEFDLQEYPFEEHDLQLDYRLTKVPFRDEYCLCAGGGFDDEQDLDDEQEKIPCFKHGPFKYDEHYGKDKDQQELLQKHKREKRDRRDGQTKAQKEADVFAEDWTKSMRQDEKRACIEIERIMSCGPEYKTLLPPTKESTTYREEPGSKPRLLLKLRIRRRRKFHVGNIVLQSLVASVAFATYLFKPKNEFTYTRRLGSNVTVLFTTITLWTGLSTDLPKLPYDTYLNIHARCAPVSSWPSSSKTSSSTLAAAASAGWERLTSMSTISSTSSSSRFGSFITPGSFTKLRAKNNSSTSRSTARRSPSLCTSTWRAAA